ncbi:MAG: TetR/AcrR family transcriptional regulator [Aliishimia sp.]
MARPREFDPDTAMQDAMNVFWDFGYEDASLPRLLSGMGLTRGSFYKAFEGKKPLFLSTLRRYEDIAVQPAIEMLSDPALLDGSDRIERALRSVTQAVRAGDQRGCMLCSTAAGPAYSDPDIQAVVQELLGKMRGGFETALAATLQTPRALNAEADMLVTQYAGLRILSRSGLSVDALDRSIDAILKQLR